VSHFLSHTPCLTSSMSTGSETVIGMTAMLGYARVSTTGQDLDVQLTALGAAGVELDRVFTDKLSGSARPYGGWGLLAHVSVGCRRESGPGR